MTNSNAVLNEEVYQSFSSLRSSVDALVCAADLIGDGGENEALGYMFCILSSRIESDLTAFFNTLCLSRS